MANDFFNATGYPATRASGASSSMRAQLAAIAAAFDKLAPLTGNGGKFLTVNAGATGYSVSSALTESGGNITITGTTTLAELAVTGRLVTSAGAATFSVAPTYAADPGSANVLARKSYVDAAAASAAAAAVGSYLPLAGGTLAGALLVAAGTVGAPGIAFAGDSNTGMWSPAADTIAWSVAGGELARLRSGFGLGVGMTPAYRVDATGGNGNGYRYTGSAVQVMMGESGVLGAVGTLTNHALTFLANNAVVGRFSAAGNFGVGVDPSYKLDVASAADPTATPTARFGTSRQLFLQPGVGTAAIFGPVLGFGAHANGGTANYIQPSGLGMTGGALITGPYGGGLDFYAYNAGAETGTTQTLASTLRMSLSAAGNLGIGLGPDASIRLDMQGPAGAPGRAALRAVAGQSAYFSIAGNGLVPGSTSFDLQQDSSGAVDIVQRSNARMSLYTNGAERLQLSSAGQLFAQAIHNNASGASGTTPMLASGTYTPTFTAGANISGGALVATAPWAWFRIGNVVHFAGQMSSTGAYTAANTFTQFEFTLPVSSELTTVGDLTGTLSFTNRSTAATQLAQDQNVDCNPTSNRGRANFFPNTTSGAGMYLIGTYEIK